MSDSGLPSSLPDGRRKTTYEPGGNAFTPSNTEGDYFITSHREALEDGLEDQQHSCQSPSVQPIPPQLKMGGAESIANTAEPECPSSLLGEQFHAMPLQYAGSSVDTGSSSPVTKRAPPSKCKSTPGFSHQEQKQPLQHSASCPEVLPFEPIPTHPTQTSEGIGNRDSIAAGDTSSSLRYFDVSGRPSYYLPVDANLHLRGIPEGNDRFVDPEETRLKVTAHSPEEEGSLENPLAARYTAKDCTACIGSLLDNTGQINADIRKKKQQILIDMMPKSSPFPAKTIIGLAEVHLPAHTHMEIQLLCSENNPGSFINTCVHLLLKEMKSEGRRLAHLVEYFWKVDSKRVDLLRLVRDIHQGCQFCDNIFQQLP